jgi:hypothetical protein
MRNVLKMEKYAGKDIQTLHGYYDVQSSLQT